VVDLPEYKWAMKIVHRAKEAGRQLGHPEGYLCGSLRFIVAECMPILLPSETADSSNVERSLGVVAWCTSLIMCWTG
jgi:hypothetical protein